MHLVNSKQLKLHRRAGQEHSKVLLWHSCCCPAHPSKGAWEPQSTSTSCQPWDTAAVSASSAATASISHSEGLWAQGPVTHLSHHQVTHTRYQHWSNTRTELKSFITFHGQTYRSVLQKLLLFIHIQQLRNINLFPQFFPTSLPRDYSFYCWSQQEVLQGLD